MSLIFKSAFEGDMAIAKDSAGREYISGTDRTTGYSWDRDLPADEAYFVYLSGSEETFATTEIRKVIDRKGELSQVLYMGVNRLSPHSHCINRNEFSLFTPSGFSQGYIKYWMKLQDNLVSLSLNRRDETVLPQEQFTGEIPDRPSPKDKHFWRLLMEWKEPDSHRPGGTNNFRSNLWIKGIGDDIHWVGTVQQVQPERVTEWEGINRQVSVPTGEWFQVESFWKKGENGRLWFAVNGREVFDFRGRTEHKDQPMDLKFWSIFKLYADPDWFVDAPMEQWIDDVEIHTDFPEGHGSKK